MIGRTFLSSMAGARGGGVSGSGDGFSLDTDPEYIPCYMHAFTDGFISDAGLDSLVVASV